MIPPALFLPRGWRKVLEVLRIARNFQGGTDRIWTPTWEGFNLKIRF
jgi:hypothetical protein